MPMAHGRVATVAVFTLLVGCTSSAAPPPAEGFALPRCDGASGVVAAYSGPDEAIDETVDIFGIDQDDTVVRLTEGNASSGPAFSPDGATIAFGRGSGGSYAGAPTPATSLWLMDSDGSHERVLVEVVEVNDSAYSPDGSRIAFVGRVSAAQVEPKLHVLNADGGDVRQVTEDHPAGIVGNVSEREVAWSPDGTELAFVRWQADRFQVGIVSVDTGSERIVHASSGGIFDLAWSGRGEHLLFTAERESIDVEPLAAELHLGTGELGTRVEASYGATYLTADGSSILSRPSTANAGFELVITSRSGVTVSKSFDGSIPFGPLAFPQCALR